MKFLEFMKALYISSVNSGLMGRPTTSLLEGPNKESRVKINLPLNIDRDVIKKIKDLSDTTGISVKDLLIDSMAFGIIHTLDIFEGDLLIDERTGQLGYGAQTFH